MKKTDLEKNKGLKLTNQLRQSSTAARFGGAAASAAVAPDRRARRKLDQEQGLIPFPIKISQTLAEEIRQLAVEQNQSVNEVVTALLEKSLGR